MNRRYPEPRYSPAQTDEEVRWLLARRSVYLELRDQYAALRKR